MNLRECLTSLESSNGAIAQFNIHNLEWVKFILEAAFLKNSPVILGVSEQSLSYMGGYEVVSSLVTAFKKKYPFPIFLSLDHATSVESCQKAIAASFDLVMFDGSMLPLKENIEKTREIMKNAKASGVLVEGEIGVIAEGESSSLEEAQEYVRETGVPLLALAMGNAHGIYQGEPKLDTSLLEKWNFSLPLVLHGGSGLPREALEVAMAWGVRKINFNTELQVAWSKEMRTYLKNNAAVFDPRKIIGSGSFSIRQVVCEKIDILKSASLIAPNRDNYI